PPTVRSKRESPSVTMSSPAVSCSFTMQETASMYCSRKRESPRASLKARPWSTSVNHEGRGQEPVTVVGSVSSRVALSMRGLLPAGRLHQLHGRLLPEGRSPQGAFEGKVEGHCRERQHST